jgi:hypothetical protein
MNLTSRWLSRVASLLAKEEKGFSFERTEATLNPSVPLIGAASLFRPRNRSGLLGVATVRKVSGYPAAGPRLSPGAEAVGYAIDPKRHLSPTPPTLIGDVDGTVDRFCDLSLA